MATESLSNKKNWDKCYLIENTLENELNLEREHPVSKTQWFETLKLSLTNRFESLNALKSIELGSGTGKISLSFARLGVETFLIDYSEEALSLSKKIFEKNLTNEQMKKVHFIIGDITDLSPSFFNQFDFSFSSGVAEHFIGDTRKEVILNHFKVLNNNGLTFIAVPNYNCPFYWLHRKISKNRGWNEYDEIPFSRREIRSLIEVNDYEFIKIFGQNLFGDLFWLFPPLSLSIKLITGSDNKNVQQFENNLMYFFLSKKTIFGHYFGYSITLIAGKSKANGFR
ncbi:MAG TPA: class I SAM-dependent methyltransferase [Methanoregulaceae archaeon]|nr:class I SAM-dependent methyltransferase [Methanoregulaceae archaeon]